MLLKLVFLRWKKIFIECKYIKINVGYFILYYFSIVSVCINNNK